MYAAACSFDDIMPFRRARASRRSAELRPRAPASASSAPPDYPGNGASPALRGGPQSPKGTATTPSAMTVSDFASSASSEAAQRRAKFARTPNSRAACRSVVDEEAVHPASRACLMARASSVRIQSSAPRSAGSKTPLCSLYSANTPTISVPLSSGTARLDRNRTALLESAPGSRLKAGRRVSATCAAMRGGSAAPPLE